MDQLKLESLYHEYTKNFTKSLPDGILQVNIRLLHSLDLLDSLLSPVDNPTSSVTSYFHMVETPEKITLFNEEFAIWIVPEITNDIPTTYAFIAKLFKNEEPHLELVFSTSGIYNSSFLVLRTLERILAEILENENLIRDMEKVL